MNSLVCIGVPTTCGGLGGKLEQGEWAGSKLEQGEQAGNELEWAGARGASWKWAGASWSKGSKQEKGEKAGSEGSELNVILGFRVKFWSAHHLSRTKPHPSLPSRFPHSWSTECSYGPMDIEVYILMSPLHVGASFSVPTSSDRLRLAPPTPSSLPSLQLTPACTSSLPACSQWAMNSLVCIGVPINSGGNVLGGKVGVSWSKLGASWASRMLY